MLRIRNVRDKTSFHHGYNLQILHVFYTLLLIIATDLIDCFFCLSEVYIINYPSQGHGRVSAVQCSSLVSIKD